MATKMYTNWQPYIDNISNNTDNQLTALIEQTSIATNYIPGTLILAAAAIILFLVLKSRNVPTSTAFTAISFVHMVMAVLVYPLHLISGIHFYIALILVPISAFILWLNR